MVGALETLIVELRNLRDEGVPRDELVRRLAQKLCEFLRADQVVVVIHEGSRRSSIVAAESERDGGIGASRSSVVLTEILQAFSDDPITSGPIHQLSKDGAPLFVHDLRVAKLSALQREMLETTGILSFGVIPIEFSGGTLSLEVQYYTRFARWRQDERSLVLEAAAFLDELCRSTTATSSPATIEPVAEPAIAPQATGESPSEAQYQRLIAYGNLIVVRTNQQLEVIEVDGDTQSLLGVSREKLLGDRGFWFRFLHPLDLRRVVEALRSVQGQGIDLSEEIRVINQATGEERWLLLKARQLRNPEGAVVGWEGFGIDISDRRRVQEQLLAQRKRLEALYEVSRSVQLTSDPAVVALRGLRALVKATGSDAGLGCFHDRTDGSIEVVAAEGLSREYVEDLAQALEGQSLLRSAIETKEGFLLENIQTDQRAVVDLARREGLRSTIVMPLIVEGLVLGAIALFCRRASQYTKADFDVVSAVSNQIALAARQAEYYAAERRQAASLAALYRLSHELSKHLSAKDVAEHAFPIIQEELASRRMWLGVINDQGTHLVGQAGFGPGVRQSLVSLQVELTNDDDFLNRAVRSRQPVVVEPDQIDQCLRLRRVLTRLKLGTLIVVPLQALSQLVGALVIEPAIPSAFFAQKKLPLLSSMAGEIATVLLARRFEARMAEAEKMRMAGLLASGVAHNFNNMLQAVMGQASLIEMQSPVDSPLRKSAAMITDAATRGAGLVKQLLTFTASGPQQRERVGIGSMLLESRELYRSILGAGIELVIEQSPEQLPEVLADYSQVQHVISNILVNAREALGDTTASRVRLSAREVILESGEVDPNLPPGEYVRVDIEDNGPGMDAERRVRCFEPFYTTKNYDTGTGLGFGGTGLGLSSAYSIMRQHDGAITVQSAPGRGSTFSLYFRALPTAVVELSDGSSNGRVALVGWDSDLAGPFIAALKGMGVNAFSVSATEALLPNRVTMLAQQRSLLIDIDIVGIQALTLAKEAKARNTSIQIALIAKDPAAWSKQCEGYDLLLVDRPRGIWAVHAIAKRLFGIQPRATLREQVLREQGSAGRSESSADEVSSPSSASVDQSPEQPPKVARIPEQ